jgi:hypothetical protein
MLVTMVHRQFRLLIYLSRAWALWLGVAMLLPLEAVLEVVPGGRMVFKEDRSCLVLGGKLRIHQVRWGKIFTDVAKVPGGRGREAGNTED